MFSGQRAHRQYVDCAGLRLVGAVAGIASIATLASVPTGAALIGPASWVVAALPGVGQLPGGHTERALPPGMSCRRRAARPLRSARRPFRPRTEAAGSAWWGDHHAWQPPAAASKPCQPLACQCEQVWVLALSAKGTCRRCLRAAVEIPVLMTGMTTWAVPGSAPADGRSGSTGHARRGRVGGRVHPRPGQLPAEQERSP